MKHLKGKIIKHKRAMDVCCEVLQVFEGSTHYKLKVHWINMCFVESFYMNMVERIKIKKENIYDWGICRDRNVKCLRDAPWEYFREASNVSEE